MFYGCSSLTSVPQMDTSNVVEMVNMFYDCSSLTSVPQMDTSNVMSTGAMLRMFNGVPNSALENTRLIRKDGTLPALTGRSYRFDLGSTYGEKMFYDADGNQIAPA